MHLRYLPTAEPGLRWMRDDYKRHPNLDIVAASAALTTAERTIASHPESAPCFEDFERVREYHIRGTHFALLYVVTAGQILIIDVRDTRGPRSADRLRKFLADRATLFSEK